MATSLSEYIKAASMKESELQVLIDDTVNSDLDAWTACVKSLSSFYKGLVKPDAAKLAETCGSYTRSIKVITRVMPPNEILFESCSLDKVDPAQASKLRKLFQDCIVSCLQVSASMPDILHRRLINYISRHVLPLMNNPLILSQFFLTSLDAPCKKTATAALVPLVHLMVTGGLGDIPELFPKLYSLLSADSLPEAPRKQLFPLLSRMLESSLIPQKWVAAFVKRLARVAVTTTDHSVALWAVTAVYSLAQKHSTACRALFHSDLSGPLGVNDEFTMHAGLVDAADQVKKSCLWEVNLLLCHGCPAVSRLSQLFKTNLFSVSAKQIASVDFAGLTDAALFQRERKTTKRKALEFAYIGGKMEDERVAKLFRN